MVHRQGRGHGGGHRAPHAKVAVREGTSVEPEWIIVAGRANQDKGDGERSAVVLRDASATCPTG
jgi:hypothetical protein